MRSALRSVVAIVPALLAAACGGATPAPVSPSSTTTATKVASASAAAGPVTFIEDDYARALADARAAHRPLFVDAWAPWCHTCLSMRTFTFRDAKVQAHASEFTWASIDTEKPENAAWVAAHPMHSWPTLYVVDPNGDRSVLEWANSATADELVALLAGARTAMDGSTTAQVPPGAAALEAKLDALIGKKDELGCAQTAEKELPAVGHGGGRATTTALRCAVEIPTPSREPLLRRLIDRAQVTVADPGEPILPDDRSDLYEAIVDALKTEDRAADAKQAATAWAAYLDGEARRAPDPATRTVFDAHRLEAWLFIGTPELAVPMLQQSAQDFPGDYNPPARLARAYLAMKQYDNALAAIDRGLSLVRGPRALRLSATKADILEARGDRSAAATALNEGVAKARTTSLPPRYAKLADDLAKRAQTLQAAPR